MKKLTVIELSEQTGLTRSQIYYLNKKHNLINSNEKINYEFALPIITTLTIKKAKKANEKNFRQILNMLILQNMALQKQLDLANEREKTYLAELASYRQNLPLESALIPSKNENNAQTGLENDLDNLDENSQDLMQPESENHASTESCYDDNTETESANETGIQPLLTGSFQKETTLSESDNRDGEPSRQKNEMIERKDSTFLSTPSPTPDDTMQPLIPNKLKKTTTTIAARIPKNISVTVKPKLSDYKQNNSSPTNESITDQNNLNKKDNHDY